MHKWERAGVERRLANGTEDCNVLSWEQFMAAWDRLSMEAASGRDRVPPGLLVCCSMELTE